jgi:hypothetical protein
LPECDGGHDLSGGLAHERGDRNEGVAAGAQGVNEDRQGGDSSRAVAAAVVHEDDGAAKLRLDLHGVELGKDRAGDVGGRLVGMLVPIVGIDLAADDDEAFVLDMHDGRGLVVGVGFLVDIVRRAEVEGLDAQLAGEEALGELDLEVQLLC